MKCSLFAVTNQDAAEMLQWLSSIGIELDTSDDLTTFVPFVHVELVNTPSALEVFSQSSELAISRITSHGISFYVDNPPQKIFGNLGNSTEGERADVIIFCPMSNVKAIYI